MILREYQARALAEVQSVYRSGLRRALLVSPTGSGKSAMTSHMLERTQKRTLILCHRENLRDMICEGLPVPHAVIASGRAIPPARVHVGMMQTVARRLDVLPRYDWVISDEAHLAMCATWRSILQHYKDAWHLGLSATPCRLDGQGLGAEYEKIVYGPSIGELTMRGFLVPLRVFAPPIDVKVSPHDSLDAQASKMDKPSITGDAIAHYRRIAAGRQAIVFCCNIAHAKSVAAQFTAAGIAATSVDGTDRESARKIADFEARKYLVLVNVELLTTGFDCPQIEVEIMLRRTDSLALYLQMIGRVLRIAYGKPDAVLIDHVGNVLAHGFPDDDREWSLDGKLANKRPPSVKQCSQCYACHRPAPRCPQCGFVYVQSETKRRPLQEVDGELQEITAAKLTPLKKDELHALIRTATSHDTLPKIRAALDAIRKARGYSPGWTHQQFQLHLQALRRRGSRAA